MTALEALNEWCRRHVYSKTWAWFAGLIGVASFFAMLWAISASKTPSAIIWGFNTLQCWVMFRRWARGRRDAIAAGEDV